MMLQHRGGTDVANEARRFVWTARLSLTRRRFRRRFTRLFSSLIRGRASRGGLLRVSPYTSCKFCISLESAQVPPTLPELFPSSHLKGDRNGSTVPQLPVRS